MARPSSRKNPPVTSLRLWRQIAQLNTTDPIALRASQMRKPAIRDRRLRIPPPLILIASLAAVVCIAIEPGLVILLFALPMSLITLMVASPLLLPIVTWVFGAALIAGIVGGIHREKRQHTYELLCSSEAGALGANLSFAAGILHRGGWFAVLRWGSLATLRGGAALLILLSLLVLWQLATAGGVGVDQARLLFAPALLLLLYYSHLTGTMALGVCLGLVCGGLPLGKPDATMLGLCAYIAATALPLASGALVYLAGRALLVEGDAASLLVLEAAAALCVIVAREVAWRMAWRGVVWRLGSPNEQDILGNTS